MAKTLADLRAQTRTYLDEATQADWKDAEVDREINNGYQEVITAVMEVYEEYYLNSVEFDTEANKQEYTTADGLPADFFKIRRLEVNFNPEKSGVRTLCRPVTLDDIKTDLSNTNPAITSFRSPVYYLIGGGSTDYKVGLMPVPTSDGPDLNANPTCKMWFVESPQDLLFTTDEVLIPYVDRYYGLISRYAASVLLNKGQQEDKAATNYMALFERGLLKMQQQLEERISDGSKRVVDVESEDVDFSSYGLI